MLRTCRLLSMSRTALSVAARSMSVQPRSRLSVTSTLITCTAKSDS